jgi:hypothetical protein
MTKRPTMPMALVLATLSLGACPSDSTPAPAKAEAKADATKAEAEAKAAEGEAKVETKAAEAKLEAKAETPTPVEPGPEVAAPPKTAGLVPSPLPAAKDKAVPAVVFAALPDRNTREWEIDIVDFSGMDVKRLEKKLEADMKAMWERAGAEGGEGGEGGEEEEGEGEEASDEPPNPFATKAGKALVPAGFAVGDPWTLITPKGAEHRTAKGFNAVSMEGSGQLHFYVRLGKAPKGIGELEPAVALRGHLPVTTKLEVPKPVGANDLGPDVLDRLVSALVKELEPEAREIVKAKPVEQSEVKLYPGRFPGGRTHAAFVMANENSETNPPISAFLFTKADGSVEVAVIPDVLGTVELVGLLDVDGDGYDEIFYEDGYHEGWYAMMMQWEGETPTRRVLTGDGI